MLAKVLTTRKPALLDPTTTTVRTFAITLGKDRNKINTIETTVIEPKTTATPNKPWLLCLSGMGDNSAAYRHIAPKLAAAGYVCIVPDYRGTGLSSAHFQTSDYAPELIAQEDAEAVLIYEAKTKEALERRGVVIIAHSFSPASATWMAADRASQDYVRGLVMIGAFARAPPMNFAMRLLIRSLFAWPWGASAWGAFYKGLYKSPKTDAADLAEHVADLVASLDFEHLKALRAMAFASKDACNNRLGEVKCPVLVIYGSADPDFANPADEAAFVASKLTSSSTTIKMVQGAGHYPHVEDPAECLDAIYAFIESRL